MALQNLSMRISETISESTRDLNFIGRSPNAEYFDAGEDKIKKIRKQLESTSERDILDAMKRLVALISKGRNVSEYFAQVVKNVGSHHLETRKLVYVYLIRYADSEPDIALLSVNTFQKDLSDSSPLIRAMALRVLSSIRVPMIGSIVVLGIKKCASDLSPYVRKAAALAIPKCYDLDPTHLPALMKTLETLLRDRSPLSIGAIAVAFNSICHTRLDLLHQHFRRLCRILGDTDEWGQVQLLDLLSRYARVMLKAPSPDGSNTDPDLRLLLHSTTPLFYSRNAAVTIAVVRIYFYLAPASERSRVIAPLLNLMHTSPDMERVVLSNFLVIAQKYPDLLRPHILRFIVRSKDIPQCKRLKIQVLTSLIDANNVDLLIAEFTDYVMDVDNTLVADAIRAIGRVAQVVPEATERCLSTLMTFMNSDHEPTVSHAVLVLKVLFQRQQQASALSPNAAEGRLSPQHIIAPLARRFGSLRHPSARACVIWLVGQYAGAPTSEANTVIPGVYNWAPDVLRLVAKSFTEEAEVVQLQAVTLAVKLLVLSAPTSSNYDATPAPRQGQLSDKAAHTVALLVQYIFAQAAASPVHYDVRDRARTLGALVRGINMDVYRASVASATSLSAASRSNVSIHLGNGDRANDGVEVSAGEWDRQVRAHALQTPANGHGVRAAQGEDGARDDDATAGGVTLRVEQVRVVLFEGKIVTGWEPSESELSRGFGAAACYPLGTMGNLVGRSLLGAEDRVLTFSGDSDGTDPSLRDSPDDAPLALPTQALGSGSSRNNGGSGVGVASLANAGFKANQRDVLASPSLDVTELHKGTSYDPVAEKRKKWDDLDAFYGDDDGDDDDDHAESEGEGEDEETETEADEDEEEEEDDDDEDVNASGHRVAIKESEAHARARGLDASRVDEGWETQKMPDYRQADRMEDSAKWR